VGRLPVPLVVVIALAAGLFNPAVAGGWTAQLPRLVTGSALSRGFALDAMTYSVASLAVPSACWLSRHRPARADGPRPAPHRQVAAGFAAIVTGRPLLRATATSVVSYAGIGMLLVCCPVLGAQRLGGSSGGALLISAIAAASLVVSWVLSRRPPRGQPDVHVLVSTLVIEISMAAAAVAPGWLTVAAIALGGAGEGPQLTALFAVRHREAPEQLRGQIFTSAASLKIGGLAAGAALAGPLAGRSVTACLLIAAGFELCAAAAYLLIRSRPEAAGPVSPPEAAGSGSRSGRTTRTSPEASTTAVRKKNDYHRWVQYVSGAQWWLAS
jgi:hypothetical protein